MLSNQYEREDENRSKACKDNFYRPQIFVENRDKSPVFSKTALNFQRGILRNHSKLEI